MANLRVYDENVKVPIIRNGSLSEVPFCELKDGDAVTISNSMFGRRLNFVCAGDAHLSGDATYEGWLVYDTRGGDHYPEDFGASLKAYRVEGFL